MKRDFLRTSAEAVQDVSSIRENASLENTTIVDEGAVDKMSAGTSLSDNKGEAKLQDQPTLKSLHKTQTNQTDDKTSATTTAVATARFPNGTLGYIADPTSLRSGIAAFLTKDSNTTNTQNDLQQSEPRIFWKLLQEYQVQHRNGTYSGYEVQSPDYVCALGPGRGLEQDYGYQILSEKVHFHDNNNTTLNTTQEPRILCLVYTYPKMRDLQRTQALTWGYTCDGYLAFSTETIPSLGLVDLQHSGEESYNNMWQKVRSIWMYVYQHYIDDYDFFHLGGDDLYLIVENLRKFLLPFMNTTTTKPLYFGQWIPLLRDSNNTDYYVSGGPGYTLNQLALQRLVVDALPICRVDVRASYEDRLVSHCLRELGIKGSDTRDTITGEQLYHDCAPAHLYTFRSTRGRGSFHAKAASYWEMLPHPATNTSILPQVGPKHELEAAGTYSVAFHDIYHPLYMARLHSILHRTTCPETTALGRALALECNAL